jgi:hypothetical protein
MGIQNTGSDRDSEICCTLVSQMSSAEVLTDSTTREPGTLE